MSDLFNYYINITAGKHIPTISTLSGVPAHLIHSLLRGRLLLTYNQLLSIANVCGSTESELRNVMLSSHVLIHRFWADLYPDSPGINCLGLVMKEIILAKQIPRKDIYVKMGIAQSRLSNMESGRVPVSYDSISSFAKIMDVDMDYIYERLRNIPFYSVKIETLCQKIKLQRKVLSHPISSIASSLDITYDRYMLFEAGKKPLDIEKCKKLCSILSLDADEYIAAFTNLKFLTELQPKKASDLFKPILPVINNINSFRYIMGPNKQKYSCKHICTYILLVLFNNYNNINRKDEILKSLELIDTDPDGEINISDYFIEYGLNTQTDLFSHIFDVYMKKNAISYKKIALMSDYSIAYVQNAPGKPSLKFVLKSSDIVCMNLSVSLDYILSKATITDEFIDIEYILKMISKKKKWKLFNADINSEDLSNIITIALSNDTTENKYAKIIQVSFPANEY